MRYVLGLDAGGTKTVALVADEAGGIVGEARGGGANVATHGELGVEKVLHDVMDRAAADREIAAVCLGMAGVDRAEDAAVIRGILRRLGHRDRVRVVNDAVIALVAGTSERVGLAVLAGTGSIAYGADREGRTARAGGLGWILADEGSAQWMGREALRAAVRAADGRGPRTALLGLALEAFRAEGVAEVSAAVYERGAQPSELGRLAWTVEAAVGQGDPVAGEILETAAKELALAARAVYRLLVFAEGPVPVVLAGGAFKACPSLVTRVPLHLDVPGADPRLLAVEPAAGAVALARDLLI
ncbi:MAG TPA: BadF/BadG/BcrA/BcrD ATPase family protein [Candidatus Thermoplasmatota archaeon]|jgi:N-acetylglucosamine kinase-like BadF-type ATPase